MRSSVWVGLSLAFAIGCATARFVVPPAHAANVQRWEYLCFAESGASEVQQKLNAAGAQGWDLVAANGGDTHSDRWCMKRPLP